MPLCRSSSGDNDAFDCVLRHFLNLFSSMVISRSHNRPPLWYYCVLKSNQIPNHFLRFVAFIGDLKQVTPPLCLYIFCQYPLTPTTNNQIDRTGLAFRFLFIRKAVKKTSGGQGNRTPAPLCCCSGRHPKGPSHLESFGRGPGGGDVSLCSAVPISAT